MKRRYLRFLPSAVTLGAMACGFCSVEASFRAAWGVSAVAILTACLLDLLDGWLARLLAASSRLGTVLDSLSDFVSFGLAPAVLLYREPLRPFGPAGIALCATFALCAGLRLIRFAAQSGSAQKTEFVGLPTTAAAMVVASGTLLGLRYPVQERFSGWLWLIAACSLSVLMVGSLRYRSAKGLLDRSRPAKALVAVVVLTALFNLDALAAAVWFASVVYVLSGPFRRWGAGFSPAAAEAGCRRPLRDGVAEAQ